ncbi:MAG: hypothetical protein HY719_14390, partial [Planctomycetes bacterium]|nr:hypothetical protein [Planctomycetota bacterium]
PMGCCFKSNASVGCAPTARADAWFTLYERNLGDGPAHAVFTLAGPCEFSVGVEYTGAGSPPNLAGGWVQVNTGRVFPLAGSAPFTFAFQFVTHATIRVVVFLPVMADMRFLIQASDIASLFLPKE